ncbi:hypothetical protein SAZ_06920 [Streptomyces noursei ZPM]|nr:hypothetical protein SAZ_06920 [Streptomyces noursei ZPM]EPY93718.1 hypothetical protein K530_46675 [Streptomyces noursei CCRC 11814]
MARRPTERKVYAHTKLRRLRREHGMNQVESEEGHRPVPEAGGTPA